MALGRVLVEEFQPEVLKWLRERVELVVINPWVEPQRWELEVTRVDAVISRKGKITREQMERGRLKIIARTGVGVDPSRVDLEAAKEHKIWVTNQPGSNAVAVAELVFGQMIALVRHTHRANRAVKEDRWSDYLKFIGTELAGKTLGIVGMGRIGTAVARRAAGFSMRLLGYDPYPNPLFTEELGGEYVSFEELLRQSDFITLHLPLTPETRGVIGAHQLALARPTAFLINCSRGALVDEDAVYAALTEGRLAGFATDVYPKEPPPPHPLYRLPNVIVLPHVASYTPATTARMGQIGLENLLTGLRGELPENTVNREVSDCPRWRHGDVIRNA